MIRIRKKRLYFGTKSVLKTLTGALTCGLSFELWKKNNFFFRDPFHRVRKYFVHATDFEP